MKIPLSWLKEYVDIDASPEVIAERLTFSGIEVEEIETVGSDYEGIVVGEIKDIKPHPSADRLRLCIVNNGNEDINVVCGAPNFDVGDKAPFIGIGHRLPDGTKIKKSKIRGELSFGMLCAEDELGISEDHSNIMLLSRDIKTGTPFSDIMGAPETVLHLEITWNRSDCLSVIGVARELAALFNVPLKLPSVDFSWNCKSVEDMICVTIKDNEKCKRYIARILQNVEHNPTPAWMSRRLSLCGIRPVSSIVDITNYVMIESGQPLHAFDYDLLEGKEIVVRCAEQGEKITTLDNIDRDIIREMLIIADSEKPVAIAGVMGGAGSEIDDKTSTVLLESACFDTADIHKTSSALGLATESSHRFERGVDILNVDWASRRSAMLMSQYCGATVVGGVIDIFPHKPLDINIKCIFQHVRDLIGINISNGEIISILESLGLSIVEKDNASCLLNIPSFRMDLKIEADLIEEVARIYGLDKISALPPESIIVTDKENVRTRAVTACRSKLIGLGLSEIMNYSFLSEQLLNVFNSDDCESRVILPNPVSEDYAVLRNSLIPQMVESLGKNFVRQIEEAKFFEIGKIFKKNNKGFFGEEDRLSIGLMGKAGRAPLDRVRAEDREEMFFWLKGIVESLCSALHLNSECGETGVHKKLTFTRSKNACFDDNCVVTISFEGCKTGIMGLIKPQITKKWRITGPIAVAEMAVTTLLSRFFELPLLKPLPTYPSITRDMAVIVKEEITHEEILAIISKNTPEDLTKVELFDTFRNAKVGSGRKSLAYSMVYRSLNKTLTDEDANRYHENIKNLLRKELKVEIREK